MVEDLNINISCNISKYFWRFIDSNKIDITEGEFPCKIVFFEALPDDFYDLIESNGADMGQVKGILDERDGGVTGCRELRIDGATVYKNIYGYTIHNDDGERGFYTVIYDKDEGITIVNPISDIVAIAKNIIIDLDDDEHTVKGFLIQNENDYLLAYCRMTNPITVSKHLVFTRNTKIINVGLCENNNMGDL